MQPTDVINPSLTNLPTLSSSSHPLLLSSPIDLQSRIPLSIRMQRGFSLSDHPSTNRMIIYPRSPVHKPSSWMNVIHHQIEEVTCHRCHATNGVDSLECRCCRTRTVSVDNYGRRKLPERDENKIERLAHNFAQSSNHPTSEPALNPLIGDKTSHRRAPVPAVLNRATPLKGSPSPSASANSRSMTIPSSWLTPSGLTDIASKYASDPLPFRSCSETRLSQLDHDSLSQHQLSIFQRAANSTQLWHNLPKSSLPASQSRWSSSQGTTALFKANQERKSIEFASRQADSECKCAQVRMVLQMCLSSTSTHFAWPSCVEYISASTICKCSRACH